MEKQELKELLKGIKENEYKVPDGVNPYQLSLEMMDYIGDTDAELRDQLIFTNLFNWLLEKEVLSLDEIHELLNIAIDENHLLKGLGEVSDSVFTRTFSVLIVAVAIYKHRNEAFLTETELQNAFETLMRFYDEDTDVRGYVDGKGWAHGAAHGADAIDEFARCEEIGYEGLKRILDGIYKKVNINYYGYIHFEDERMCTPVIAVLERNIIPTDEIVEWIQSFKDINKIGKNPEDLTLEFNVNIFLKSLYFRLIDQPDYEIITNTLKEVLHEISLFKNM